MHTAETTPAAPVRNVHMDLRTGDVLAIGGVRIRLEYKKGRAARMLICAPADTRLKKIAAAAQPVPSLPE